MNNMTKSSNASSCKNIQQCDVFGPEPASVTRIAWTHGAVTRSNMRKTRRLRVNSQPLDGRGLLRVPDPRAVKAEPTLGCLTVFHNPGQFESMKFVQRACFEITPAGPFSKQALRPRILVILLNLVLLSSCVTGPDRSPIAPASEMPGEVAIDQFVGTGRGPLLVTLRLASGEEFQCSVDTGSPCTVLPKFLEPKLGQRLGASRYWTLQWTNQTAIFAAPKLYLGNTLLVMDNRIQTIDEPIGILGMDCLGHYCIQLDFQARKMRFLDPEHLNTAALGKAYNLSPSRYAQFNHAGLLDDNKAEWIIDTGCGPDSMVKPTVYERAFQRQQAVPATLPGNDKTKSAIPELAVIPKCLWDGKTYTNLLVAVSERANLLGIRFLARHLVTLDFPKQVMYLNQTSTGSQEVENMAAALNFLHDLKEAGRQPGWSKQDTGFIIMVEGHPEDDIFSVRIRKHGDSSAYHYVVSQKSKDDLWKLQRAWRTDQTGRTIEEYPVP